MLGDIIAKVKNQMVGYICDEQNNIQILLETVELAGEGNYCEIGVLYGGSLCAAALYKKELGHQGLCYGVDPLDGYYMDHPTRRNVRHPFSKVKISTRPVYRNAEIFRLDNIRLEVTKSYPFPDIGPFSCVYIDGDHWNGTPLKDWESVKDITTGYVIFDNCDEDHPDVMIACHAAETSPGWDLVRNEGISFVVRHK